MKKEHIIIERSAGIYLVQLGYIGYQYQISVFLLDRRGRKIGVIRQIASDDLQTANINFDRLYRKYKGVFDYGKKNILY